MLNPATSATTVGVSRQAVYLWFVGKALPHPGMRETILGVIKELKAKKFTT
jgi:hypothetical protein